MIAREKAIRKELLTINTKSPAVVETTAFTGKQKQLIICEVPTVQRDGLTSTAFPGLVLVMCSGCSKTDGLEDL